jgi:hypothetical protein
VGVGVRQRHQQQADPTLSAEDLSRTYQVEVDFGDPPDYGSPVVTVLHHAIPAPGVRDAVRLLTAELWAACRTNEGAPTSREAARAIYEAERAERLYAEHLRDQPAQTDTIE